MTSPIIDFIEARLKADQEAAEAAGGGRWSTDRYDSVVDESDDTVIYDGYRPSHLHVEHILRHDPARVLREVQAKRRILKEHSTPHTVVDGFCTECGSDLQGGVHKRDRSYCEIHGWRECETVLALAAIYSDHPDYRKEWAA